MWLFFSLLAALLNSLRELLTRRASVRVSYHPLAASFRTILGVSMFALAALFWLFWARGGSHILGQLRESWLLLAGGAFLEITGQLFSFSR